MCCARVGGCQGAMCTSCSCLVFISKAAESCLLLRGQDVCRVTQSRSSIYMTRLVTFTRGMQAGLSATSGSQQPKHAHEREGCAMLC